MKKNVFKKIKQMKYLINYLPDRWRGPWIRGSIRLNDSFFDPAFSIELATTKADLQQAFALLHDSYVGANLMNSHLSGLRCNWYSLLPQTIPIVVKHKGNVVGTVSLVKDLQHGLPSDAIFKEENDRLRKEFGSLTEVSSLAVDKAYRNQSNIITMLLTKYLYHYARFNMKSNLLVITVHPRAEAFYKDLFFYQRNGPVKSYGLVKGALASHLSLPTSREHLDKVVDAYAAKDLRRNLALFMAAEDSRFIYPEVLENQVIYPILTPELLDYFFNQKTGAISELDDEKKREAYEIYRFIFGKETVEKIIKPVIPASGLYRNYRVPIDLSATIKVDSQFIFGRIVDITNSGCLFLSPQQFEKNFYSELHINFKLGNERFSIKGLQRWQKVSSHSEEKYYLGIKFERSIAELEELLRLSIVPKANHLNEHERSREGSLKIAG